MRALTTSVAVAGFAAAALLASSMPAAAQSSPFAVGVNVGTPGVGGELQFQVSPGLVLRGDGDWLGFHRDETYSGIPYRAKLKFATGGLFADFHPGQTPFLLTAGGYFGQRKIQLNSRVTDNVVVGGVTFTPAQIGELQGEAKLSDAQPFVGLGWDNTFTTQRAWGFRAAAGVSFSSSPRVTLASVGGTLSDNPIAQAAVAAEQASVAHDVRNYRYYPVLQIGVTHRF